MSQRVFVSNREKFVGLIYDFENRKSVAQTNRTNLRRVLSNYLKRQSSISPVVVQSMHQRLHDLDREIAWYAEELRGMTRQYDAWLT